MVDPREVDQSLNLRSINLAVSSRGITALTYVDAEMAKRVLTGLVPMHGRMIHDLKGKQISQKYGLYGEAINSIDRGKLNLTLLDEFANSSNVDIKFNHKLVKADLSRPNSNPLLQFKITKTVGKEKKEDIADYSQFEFVVGADGAYSALRCEMQKYTRININQHYIDNMYIELYIPPGKDESGNPKFSLDPNHLHIWPRDDFMLIALPNTDGSFTSTFFAPWKLAESLNTPDKVLALFRKYFKDGLELLGEQHVVEAFKNHPKGSLVCIKMNPYNVNGKAILVGDSSHAMVPFYGQGMNCGFEDVRILLELLEKNHYNTEKAFNEYSISRHDDLVSIIDLAMANYSEMSHKVKDPLFLLRKKLDGFLGRLLKDNWLPLYTMVSFRADVSYSEAVRRSKRQSNIISKAFACVATGIILGIAKGLHCYSRCRAKS